jgi:uncharacterized protein YukJ
MTLPYGFVRAKPASLPRLQSKQANAHGAEELQYHLHVSLDVNGAAWDTAVNVGTDNAADLLKYKIVQGFRNPIADTLRTAIGAVDLTGKTALPALDFLRGGILEGTGEWRVSDVLKGGAAGKEPPVQLAALLTKAFQGKNDVYVFGRFYSEGYGIHDVHMNQGSRGRYIHRAGDDGNDHNDVWQDGALMIDSGAGGWVAYFSAFTEQTVPTDELGNPLPGGHTV